MNTPKLVDNAGWAKSYVPNETFQPDNVEIIVTSYHNDPHALLGQSLPSESGYKSPVFCQLVWDNYMFFRWLEGIENVNKALGSNPEILEKVFKGVKRDAEFQKYPFVLYDEETGRSGSIYCLTGTVRAFRDALAHWIERAQKDEYWASGDDSFFDYTPDEVHLFYQICCGIGAQDLWDKFYQWAISYWYKDQEEELGFKEE